MKIFKIFLIIIILVLISGAAISLAAPKAPTVSINEYLYLEESFSYIYVYDTGTNSCRQYWLEFTDTYLPNYQIIFLQNDGFGGRVLAASYNVSVGDYISEISFVPQMWVGAGPELHVYSTDIRKKMSPWGCSNYRHIMLPLVFKNAYETMGYYLESLFDLEVNPSPMDNPYP